MECGEGTTMNKGKSAKVRLKIERPTKTFRTIDFDRELEDWEKRRKWNCAAKNGLLEFKSNPMGVEPVGNAKQKADCAGRAEEVTEEKDEPKIGEENTEDGAPVLQMQEKNEEVVEAADQEALGTPEAAQKKAVESTESTLPETDPRQEDTPEEDAPQGPEKDPVSAPENQSSSETVPPETNRLAGSQVPTGSRSSMNSSTFANLFPSSMLSSLGEVLPVSVLKGYTHHREYEEGRMKRKEIMLNIISENDTGDPERGDAGTPGSIQDIRDEIDDAVEFMQDILKNTPEDLPPGFTSEHLSMYMLPGDTVGEGSEDESHWGVKSRVQAAFDRCQYKSVVHWVRTLTVAERMMFLLKAAQPSDVTQLQMDPQPPPEFKYYVEYSEYQDSLCQVHLPVEPNSIRAERSSLGSPMKRVSRDGTRLRQKVAGPVIGRVERARMKAVRDKARHSHHYVIVRRAPWIILQNDKFGQYMEVMRLSKSLTPQPAIIHYSVIDEVIRSSDPLKRAGVRPCDVPPFINKDLPDLPETDLDSIDFGGPIPDLGPHSDLDEDEDDDLDLGSDLASERSSRSNQPPNPMDPPQFDTPMDPPQSLTVRSRKKTVHPRVHPPRRSSKGQVVKPTTTVTWDDGEGQSGIWDQPSRDDVEVPEEVDVSEEVLADDDEETMINKHIAETLHHTLIKAAELSGVPTGPKKKASSKAKRKGDPPETPKGHKSLRGLLEGAADGVPFGQDQMSSGQFIVSATGPAKKKSFRKTEVTEKGENSAQQKVAPAVPRPVFAVPQSQWEDVVSRVAGMCNMQGEVITVLSDLVRDVTHVRSMLAQLIGLRSCLALLSKRFEKAASDLRSQLSSSINESSNDIVSFLSDVLKTKLIHVHPTTFEDGEDVILGDDEITEQLKIFEEKFASPMKTSPSDQSWGRIIKKHLPAPVKKPPIYSEDSDDTEDEAIFGEDEDAVHPEDENDGPLAEDEFFEAGGFFEEEQMKRVIIDKSSDESDREGPLPPRVPSQAFGGGKNTNTSSPTGVSENKEAEAKGGSQGASASQQVTASGSPGLGRDDGDDTDDEDDKRKRRKREEAAKVPLDAQDDFFAQGEDGDLSGGMTSGGEAVYQQNMADMDEESAELDRELKLEAKLARDLERKRIREGRSEKVTGRRDNLDKKKEMIRQMKATRERRERELLANRQSGVSSESEDEQGPKEKQKGSSRKRKRKSESSPDSSDDDKKKKGRKEGRVGSPKPPQGDPEKGAPPKRAPPPKRDPSKQETPKSGGRPHKETPKTEAHPPGGQKNARSNLGTTTSEEEELAHHPPNSFCFYDPTRDKRCIVSGGKMVDFGVRPFGSMTGQGNKMGFKQPRTNCSPGKGPDEDLSSSDSSSGSSPPPSKTNPNETAPKSTPKVPPLKATAPKSTPKATAPKSTPKVSTPKASTPKAGAPKAGAPKTGAPKRAAPKGAAAAAARKVKAKASSGGGPKKVWEMNSVELQNFFRDQADIRKNKYVKAPNLKQGNPVDESHQDLCKPDRTKTQEDVDSCSLEGEIKLSVFQWFWASVFPLDDMLRERSFWQNLVARRGEVIMKKKCFRNWRSEFPGWAGGAREGTDTLGTPLVQLSQPRIDVVLGFAYNKLIPNTSRGYRQLLGNMMWQLVKSKLEDTLRSMQLILDDDFVLNVGCERQLSLGELLKALPRLWAEAVYVVLANFYDDLETVMENPDDATDIRRAIQYANKLRSNRRNIYRRCLGLEDITEDGQHASAGEEEEDEEEVEGSREQKPSTSKDGGRNRGEEQAMDVQVEHLEEEQQQPTTPSEMKPLLTPTEFENPWDAQSYFSTLRTQRKKWKEEQKRSGRSSSLSSTGSHTAKQRVSFEEQLASVDKKESKTEKKKEKEKGPTRRRH